MSPIYEEQYLPAKDALPDKATLFSRSDIDINTIYYEISGICNAKCTYCPTGSGVTKGRPARFIPPEEFSRGLDRLYELGLLNNDVFFGLFNWGDPLLHPQLDEILHILKEADQSFALSTNGSSIPKNLNSSLLDNLSYIRLSLPGFSQKSYDKIHRLDFEKVLQNIGILNELVPPNTLEVLLYAYKFNIEEISRASEYFNDKNIQFRVGMPHLMDYEDAVGYLTETIDPVKKQGIEDDLFTDHIKSLLMYKEDKKSCPYLQNQLVIDEYNNVLTCCVLSKNSEYYTVGSLFELTKDEIFDVKTRGQPICSRCMSAGVPYWYEFNCRHLPQELQAFNTQTYCYIDTGYGFSEKQKVSSNVNSRASRAPFHAFFDLRGFNNIKSLRWDPVEGRLCHISIDKIRVEMKNGDARLVEPENLAANGERISDSEFRFNTTDPWFVIPAEGQINNVAITGSWLVKDVDETIPHLNQEIVQSNMKIQSLQQTITDHDAQVALLDEQVEQLTEETQSLQGTVSERDSQVALLDGQVEQLTGEAQSLQRAISERDAQVALLDEQIEQLTEETQSLQGTVSERDAQVASLDEQTRQQAIQLMQLSNELACMKQSVVWRLLMKFHNGFVERALPQNTRRRRLYDLGLVGLRVLIHEGPRGLRIRGEKKLRGESPSRLLQSSKSSIAMDKNNKYQLIPGTTDYVYIPPRCPNNINSIIESMAYKPHFSIVVPVYNTPPDLLNKAVRSLQLQWYPHWELILVDDASPSKETRHCLSKINDPNIKVFTHPQNKGISGATNTAISHSTGDYVVLLDHDDELTEDCLFELALCINRDNPDYIYSDEDKINEKEYFTEPHYKPDWSPDTMMSTMYVCHVSCIKKSILEAVGGLRSDYDGCQDWDLILRIVEKTDKISHIPKVLYHWRIIPGSISADIGAKSYVLDASRRVREDALKRRGLSGTVEPLEQVNGYFRVNYHLVGEPLISIIIPTRDHGDVLRRCIESIFKKSTYMNFELIVLDNGSVDAATLGYLEKIKAEPNISVIRHAEPFNYSELNNIGADSAEGEILLFLNDDTEVVTPDWLERMGGYAQLGHIGAVGAKLLYPGGQKIQHAGVLNLQDGPGHAFLNQKADIPGYYLRNLIEYNWLVVTGACLMVERKKFQSIGGFDVNFPIAYNDVDLCFRLRDVGFYNLVCQSVRLIHHESLTRGMDHADHDKKERLKQDMRRLYQKHPFYYQYDPFYSINLHPNGINFETFR